MIYVYFCMQDPSQILTDHKDWHENTVTSHQTDYFKHMRVTVSAKDCPKVDFSAMEDDENDIAPTTNNLNLSNNNYPSPRNDDARHEFKSQLPPIVKNKRARAKKAAMLSNDGELPVRINPAIAPKILPGKFNRIYL